MKEKLKNLKNKKVVLGLGVFLILLVGVAIAYFSSSDTMTNLFHTQRYDSKTTEVFTSPSDWTPGDTTPKTLTVTNTGNVCENVRVWYEDDWETENGDALPNTQNGNLVGIVNRDHLADWVQDGNYIYYNKNLLANQSTSSFIKSVTYNKLAANDFECVDDLDGGRTCSTSGDGYDGATYTLTIHVETIQCSMAEKIWGVDPTEMVGQYIEYVNRQNANSITVGDEIAIGTEHFYVVNSNSTETAVLAKYNLYVGLVYDIDSSYNRILDKTLSSSDDGYGLQNSVAKGYYNQTDRPYQVFGIVPFSGKSYWSSWSTTCATYPCDIYDNRAATDSPIIQYDSHSDFYYAKNTNDYTIAYYVEPYKTKLAEFGAPNSINVRLLTHDEAVSLGCSDANDNCNNAPDWVRSTTYWIGSAGDDYFGVYAFQAPEMFSYYYGNRASSFGVRPVIVIPTSQIPR